MYAMLYEPDKKLGQNFLTDHFVVTQMVDLLNLEGGDEVVEIGAGLGALTEELAQRTFEADIEVYAVEIDERFTHKLESMLLDYPNIKIVKGDILGWLPRFQPSEGFKILGSLPFYITSPIIHTIATLDTRPKLSILLIQKEVAQKIVSTPPDASYFSSFVQTFFNVEFIQAVPKEVFDPVPEVDGAVISLVRKGVDISQGEIMKYIGFLHKAYANPRKMLNKVFSGNELKDIGMDGNLRPQNISPEKWVESFKILSAH